MRGLIVFGFLISTIIVCVLSENEQPAHGETSELAVSPDQLTHGHRSKRSPYDPILPTIVLGKSFLLGALLGKTLGRHKGWGWRPRPRGWGWKAPVVVHHSHSHGGWGGSSGGWGGWEEPVSHGWGWSR